MKRMYNFFGEDDPSCVATTVYFVEMMNITFYTGSEKLKIK